MASLLLATDLDRTLIPNGPQPESPGAREALARLVAHPGVTLAYVSGRHRELVEDAMAEWSLPRPDYVIGDVGTTIWRVPGQGDWTRDADWEAAIGADWSGRTGGELAERLSGLPGLVLQPPDRQNRHKLSWFLPWDADTPSLAIEIHQRLAALGVETRLVFSIDETADQGLLDVLPAHASKLHAIEALVARLGIATDDTVFCGDSGNDLEVLVSALPAVLVANATGPVRQAARDGAGAAGTTAQLYCASGGFLGMNGCYAAGMLEGIAHFHPWTEAAMTAKERSA